MVEYVYVAFYTTQAAHNTDSRMGFKVADYMRKSFEDANFDLDVRFPSIHPDPPTENPAASINAQVCGSNSTSLLGWWNDWHRCHGGVPGAESNILLTNSANLSGTGYLGGKYCVSSGNQIKYLDESPPQFHKLCDSSSDERYDAMQTAVHEIGHNLDLKHGHGYAYGTYKDRNYYTTPMMNGYGQGFEGSKNICGRQIGRFGGTPATHCHDFWWSNCAENNIQT